MMPAVGGLRRVDRSDTREPSKRASRLRQVLGVVSLIPGLATFAASDSLHQDTLPNGMKVITKEDRRAPVVVSMVWYRAGSMDEVAGTTGVAHVLEHMMFKGTRELKQ